MRTYTVHKVTALPSKLAANSIYFVVSGNDHTDKYVTGKSAGKVRRVINEADVKRLINAATDKLGALEIVANIAAEMQYR